MVLISLEEVKKWLVEGSDDPDTFVDLKWSVLEEERDENGVLRRIRVTHEKVPVNLLALDLEDPSGSMPVIRLVVETGVSTVDLEPSTKLRLYRFLLNTSKIPIVKFYLYGDENEIGIAADLAKKDLTREEFETALAGLLLGYSALTRVPGVKEQALEEQVKMLYLLLSKWMRDKVSCGEAVIRLVRAGLDPEAAKAMVKQVYGSTACSGTPLII